MRISRSRFNFEDGRLDRAAFKDYGEIATGSSSTVFTTSAYTVNIENGNVYNLILNDDCSFTFANPTGSGNACSFTLILKQDQVGGWTATWPAAVRWQDYFVAPTLASAPGDFDALTFFTVNGGTTWFAFRAERDHTSGVGELWTWGDNATGRLGLNDAVATDRSSPAQVGATTSWAHVSAGYEHSLAVRGNGTLWGWGRNAEGQLGNNTTTARSSPAQVGTLTDWRATTGGEYHTAAIKTDGTLWTWGSGANGRLGSNATATRSSPAQVGALTDWTSVISSGEYHTVAVKANGTLWTWGEGAYGKLGAVTNVANQSSPTQVGALTTWRQASAGSYHTLAVKTDGTLWSWGRNTHGQLGKNTATTAHISSPAQVGALTDWALVAAGGYHSVALKTDGTLWNWGRNNAGQLGDNSTTLRSSPVQVGSLTMWSAIAPGELHTVALKTDGTLWAWGDNAQGKLGLNTAVATDVSSPTQVGTHTNWSLVAAGTAQHHTLALRYPPTA